MYTIAVPQPIAAVSAKHLNLLLRGEISTVETFRQVIATFGAEVPYKLNKCQRSHRLRVEKLAMRIFDLGGKPVMGSGLWGSLVLWVEGGVAWFGSQQSLHSLEVSEQHGLERYRECIAYFELDADSRRMLVADLLPEQLKTHDAVRDLCRGHV